MSSTGVPKERSQTTGSTTRIGGLVAAAGGLALVLSLFLPWASAFGDSANAWVLFGAADLVLAVLAVVAVLAGLTAAAGRGGALSLSPRALVAGVGALTASLTVVLMFEGVRMRAPADAASAVLDVREAGMWLALVASVLVLGAGVAMNRGTMGAGRQPRVP